MSFRLLCCLGMGVFVIYLGAIMFLSHLRQPRPAKSAGPNFSARAQTLADPATGETAVTREITVSTRLAPRPSVAAP